MAFLSGVGGNGVVSGVGCREITGSRTRKLKAVVVFRLDIKIRGERKTEANSVQVSRLDS